MEPLSITQLLPVPAGRGGALGAAGGCTRPGAPAALGGGCVCGSDANCPGWSPSDASPGGSGSSRHSGESQCFQCHRTAGHCAADGPGQRLHAGPSERVPPSVSPGQGVLGGPWLCSVGPSPPTPHGAWNCSARREPFPPAGRERRRAEPEAPRGRAEAQSEQFLLCHSCDLRAGLRRDGTGLAGTPAHAARGTPAPSPLPPASSRSPERRPERAQRSPCSCSVLLPVAPGCSRLLRLRRAAGQDEAAGVRSPPGRVGRGAGTPRPGARLALAALEEGARQGVPGRAGGREAPGDLGAQPAPGDAAQPGALAGAALLRARHEPPGRHEPRGSGRSADGAGGTAEPEPEPELAPPARPPRPGHRGLARPGLRDARQEPGRLRLLLGLQRGGGPRGAAAAPHGPPRLAQRPEPPRLLRRLRHPRLRRRLHDRRLPVRQGQRRHRLGRRLPLHGAERELPVQRVGARRHVLRVRGAAARRRGRAPRRRGRRGTRGRRRGRHPAHLLPLPLGCVRRPPLHPGGEPRRARRRLRHPRRQGLLAREEQLGRALRRPGLHPHGQKPREPLRDRQLRLLPAPIDAGGIRECRFQAVGPRWAPKGPFCHRNERPFPPLLLSRCARAVDVAKTAAFLQ